MSLLTLIVVLVIVGVVLWAINTYVPMEPGIKRLLNIANIVFGIRLLLDSSVPNGWPPIRMAG